MVISKPRMWDLFGCVLEIKGKSQIVGNFSETLGKSCQI